MIPSVTDYEGTKSMLLHDPSPLNVVLLQEIQRYNLLLETIKYELTDSDVKNNINYRCKCLEV